MISPDSISYDWIMSVRENAALPVDPTLIEKMIRALCLLENLRTAGLEFTFKGGTSLILVLGRPARLSIDLDIIIHPGENLIRFLGSVPDQGIFSHFEENVRGGTIPKRHFKFFFESVISGRENSILLDILFEENPYPVYNEIQLSSNLFQVNGTPVTIRCPAVECLLADKLTAFAPNTTGILYGADKELEIIKQLFDISELFDESSDLALLNEAYQLIARKELQYRGLDSLSPIDILSDSFETACLIGMRGFGDREKHDELMNGVRKFRGFVINTRFTPDTAVLCASKAAYTASLLRSDADRMDRFDNRFNLKEHRIQNPAYNRLNRIKRTSPEAFFYFLQAVDRI